MGYTSMLEDAEDRLNADLFDLADKRNRVMSQADRLVQAERPTKGLLDALRTEGYHVKRQLARAFAQHQARIDELRRQLQQLRRSELGQADRLRQLEAENQRLRVENERLRAAAPPTAAPQRAKPMSRRKQRKQQRKANAGR
jgi:regulator of replication initiation timing